jgi:hypothetical protein
MTTELRDNTHFGSLVIILGLVVYLPNRRDEQPRTYQDLIY